MKIAIMTWFHYDNYGTALQVAALNHILKKLGHTVEIIQYYPSGKVNSLPQHTLIIELYNKAVRKFKNRYNYNIVSEQSGNKFSFFREKYLSLTNRCETLSDLEALNDKFDAFICGSDQIWSPLCFDSHYFLDFVLDPAKMVAYAPSIGTTHIDDKYIEQLIKELTKRFQHISVREKSGAEMLKALNEINAQVVLDPTLLLNGNEWNEYKEANEKVESPYLLAYFLRSNDEYWEVTNRIAKALNLSVKIIPVSFSDLNRNGVLKEGVSPSQFIHLIKNAEYICTDSFHGTAFSINLKKKFCCFERFKNGEIKNQNTRIYNILNALDLQDRLYKKGENLDILLRQIKYSPIMGKLNTLRQQSQDYLIDALNAVEDHNNKLKKHSIKRHILENYSLCCGCGSCSAVCPTGAISIVMSEDGFYEAKVHEDKCIKCGKCNLVCPFQNNSFGKRIEKGKIYSYKDIDHDLLSRSSSGGIAFRLSQQLSARGYTIVGCTFDKKEQKAKHIVIKPSECPSDLEKLQGSKYMQSQFDIAMTEIINISSPIAIFGTPCEIAGARNVLKNRNDVVYVDLICHGVPSYFLFMKYKDSLQSNYGINTKGMNVIFRYKPKGWSERYTYVADSKQRLITHQSKDEYFLMFEHGACYSKACYECRWRSTCAADLRIGDYWGYRFKNDSTGVSIILSMTEHGESILKELKNVEYGKYLKEQELMDYLTYQQIENNPRPVYYHKVIQLLSDDKMSLNDIVKKYIKSFEKRRKVIKKIHGIYNKIKK